MKTMILAAESLCRRKAREPVRYAKVRERSGGDRGYPVILYLDSIRPFRGYFVSPALDEETRIFFRDYREFSERAEELTEQVRKLFRAGKRLETESWRARPAAPRRADRVLFIRPGSDGEWSGDVYTPGIMTLEIFHDRGELEKLLCP